MGKLTQSQDELKDHLKSQLGFLERSAESFDKGYEDEAKRLAVVIRVLVHDTSRSTSLLTLLNKKNIKFFDSKTPYRSGNSVTYHGLTMMKITDKGSTYVAPLEGGALTRNKNSRIPFKVWWEVIFVIKDKNGNTFTRKDLVLNLADTDGGAHIDSSLDEEYANLSRFNSLSWKFLKNDSGEPESMNNPVLPSVRQITHEVIKTLKTEFPDLSMI
jgi:hypothetical protein